MKQELNLNFIKIHILYHASKEKIYGLWLIEELADHGYRISPGTLYPLLANMHQQGLLNSKSQVVNGKVRKYYSISTKGLQEFEVIKMKLKELIDEVMS